jgi:ABC-type branched-subunit amino acid transport system ATPase component
MNQGKVIAMGKPQEVVRNPDVIKSYLGQRSHA